MLTSEYFLGVCHKLETGWVGKSKPDNLFKIVFIYTTPYMIQQSQESREIGSSFALQLPAHAICKEKVPTIPKSKRGNALPQPLQNLISSLLLILY